MIRAPQTRTAGGSAMGSQFFSLFAGAGGLDIGLEAAGWDCRYASDIDPAAVETLKLNRDCPLEGGRTALSNAYIEAADVRALQASDILAKSGARRGDVELLAGGPPCQSWSSAGHQLGFDDPRGQLFKDFVRLAQKLDVRWLLFENVRGLLTARGEDGQPGSALALIRQKLFDAGFQTTVSLLNAADYGVPQRRVRLFIIGYRRGDTPPFPTPSHGKSVSALPQGSLRPWLTLRDALGSISPPTEDEVVRPTGRLSVELASVSPGSGVKSPGKSERTRPGGHWGYKQGAFVADLNQSARTVTANSQQDWIIDPRLGLRKLTARECAAIQTFPPEWVFAGGRTTQYRLIGNAVPPRLAKALGQRLLSHVVEVASANHAGSNHAQLLPLPEKLMSAIRYTQREEASNGSSRRSAPSRRVSRRALAGA
jgi:DNA (cytosine-5)-methyltransferase 1